MNPKNNKETPLASGFRIQKVHTLMSAHNKPIFNFSSALNCDTDHSVLLQDVNGNELPQGTRRIFR